VLERNGILAKLFADDLKVYLEITNVNDCSNLQKSLDVISMWAKDWQLELSVEKCNCK